MPLIASFHLKPHCRCKSNNFKLWSYIYFPSFPRGTGETKFRRKDQQFCSVTRAAARSTVARTSLTKSQHKCHYLSSQRDLPLSKPHQPKQTEAGKRDHGRKIRKEEGYCGSMCFRHCSFGNIDFVHITQSTGSNTSIIHISKRRLYDDDTLSVRRCRPKRQTVTSLLV